MVKIYCDKCGKDTERVAYSIEIHSLQNASPMYLSDTGRPQITDCGHHVTFTLCQDCYRDMKLPNLYNSIRKKKIQWRDEDD